jgi:hypothetical protein
MPKKLESCNDVCDEKLREIMLTTLKKLDAKIIKKITKALDKYNNETFLDYKVKIDKTTYNLKISRDMT